MPGITLHESDHRPSRVVSPPPAAVAADTHEPPPTPQRTKPHDFLPAGDILMEQKFEGSPRAEIRLEGRRVLRSDVTNDWGSGLQWQIRRNGQVIATPPARAESSYEHPEATPGTYEIVLQMW